MTISLKHRFTSPHADEADTSLVRPSNWNDEHNLTGTPGSSIGFDSSGNVVEINNAAPITITSDMNFYVATTGNDSNNGLTSGTAWRTIQHAAIYVAMHYANPFQYAIYINVADGTYVEDNGLGYGLELPVIPYPATNGGAYGGITLVGNATTPANCIIDFSGAASGHLITCNGTWHMNGFKIN